MRSAIALLSGMVFHFDMNKECCVHFLKHGKEVLKALDENTLSLSDFRVKARSAGICLGMVLIFFIYLIPFACQLVLLVNSEDTSPPNRMPGNNTNSVEMTLPLTPKEEYKLSLDRDPSPFVTL